MMHKSQTTLIIDPRHQFRNNRQYFARGWQDGRAEHPFLDRTVGAIPPDGDDDGHGNQAQSNADMVRDASTDLGEPGRHGWENRLLRPGVNAGWAAVRIGRRS